MGSTIESAIVFSLVLIVLSFLITGPEDICLDSLADCKNGMEEISFTLNDDWIASFKRVDGVKISDCSPERFCTYISGLSDCYRIVYGTIADS